MVRTSVLLLVTLHLPPPVINNFLPRLRFFSSSKTRRPAAPRPSLRPSFLPALRQLPQRRILFPCLIYYALNISKKVLLGTLTLPFSFIKALPSALPQSSARRFRGQFREDFFWL